MNLFDEISRHELGPRKPSESSFHWLNTSARVEAQRVRQVLEEWFTAFPEDGKTDLRSRIRSDRASQHLGAFFELYCSALLRQQGYCVNVHRKADRAKERVPDFEAVRDNETRFFFECTSATGPKQEEAEEARLNQVYQAIEQLDSPDFFVQAEIRRAPERSIPGEKLRNFLRTHLAELSYEQLDRAMREGGLHAPPRWRYQDGRCDITFFPVPTSPPLRGRAGVRPLGGQLYGMREVDPSGCIKRALKAKAAAYGEPRVPLVIAVNGISEWQFPADNFDIFQALFGTQVTVLQVNPRTRETRICPSRHADGFWWGPRGPQYTRASAILTASLLQPFTVGTVNPVLWHNPWAKHSLDPGSWQGLQKVTTANGTYETRSGRLAWEILGLHQNWPLTLPRL
jgi:hypothetical protein